MISAICALSINLATLTFAASSTADVVTTVHVASSGPSREANPLVGWLPSTGAQVAVGAAAEVTALYLWRRYVAKAHPTLGAVGLFTASGLHTLAAVQNEARLRAVRGR